MTKRRKYSPEFKREAVEQTRQAGVSCRQVALEIGVNPNMLTRWKRELEEAPRSAHKGSGTPRDEEVARLKRELARIKKGTCFFCAKRQRSSQKSRPEISGDRTLSRTVSHTFNVPLYERVSQRLLCLGNTPTFAFSSR